MLTDPATGQRTAPLWFAARGFSLHAATTVAAAERDGLERLCRYVNRPPLAYGRLRQLNSGHLAFALKTPWDDGTTHLVFAPLESIGRLAALTPPPRMHLIRYHGVLAPHAADRALIVPSARTRQRATCSPASVKRHRKTPNPAPIIRQPALPR